MVILGDDHLLNTLNQKQQLLIETSKAPTEQQRHQPKCASLTNFLRENNFRLFCFQSNDEN